MYCYIESENGVWTVGHYSSHGTWNPESDHGSPEAAANRVAYLNGSAQDQSTGGKMSDKQEPAIMLDENAPMDLIVQKHQLVEASNLKASEVMEQVNHIQGILKQVMKDGEHYGKIPGVAKKILMKAGAEKIGLAFRLQPKYEIERIDLPNYHREYIITCSLYHISGGFVGQGVGSCSSMESKYRYRNEQRVCPACGVAAIIPGKKEYGGGWLCWKKKDGCGAKFGDDDTSITSQSVGKVENPDIADSYNTILKMAKKRAHVDAILTATAASDIFTQDLDENTESNDLDPPQQEKPQYPQSPKGNNMPKMTALEYKDEILTMLKNDVGGVFTDEQKNDMRKHIAKNRPYRGGWAALYEKVKLEIEKETVPF